MNGEDFYNKVKAFMVAARQVEEDQKIGRPRFEDLSLAFNLIDEELGELREAVADGYLPNVADAVCDLLVVVMGMGIRWGFPIPAMLGEVLDANLAKIVDGKVLKREDGKVLKPKGWTPPDLTKFINS